jgi:Type IV secretion system pilin
MYNVLIRLATLSNCSGADDGKCLTNLPAVDASPDSLKSLLSIVFGILAAVTILIIIIQGIRFITSSGDAQKAGEARKGIIYALVGLGVAISAEVIVRLVVGKL